MGQAKKRGTYEERKKLATDRVDALIAQGEEFEQRVAAVMPLVVKDVIQNWERNGFRNVDTSLIRDKLTVSKGAE